MEPHDSHSPEVTASDNALEIYRKMITESITFRSIRPNILVIHSSYNPFSQRKFLLIRITLAHLNAIFDLPYSWQPAFARIDHTHSMERQHSHLIPKFTPKCKHLMIHAHSNPYLPPQNYRPCIITKTK